MHPGQRLGQVAVALIGDNDGRTGFRDQEVGAGDADIGGEEFCPQLGARLDQDVAPLMEGSIGRQVGVGASESVLPILQVQMERRRDDVARQFMPELDDASPPRSVSTGVMPCDAR